MRCKRVEFRSPIEPGPRSIGASSADTVSLARRHHAKFTAPFCE